MNPTYTDGLYTGLALALTLVIIATYKHWRQ